MSWIYALRSRRADGRVYQSRRGSTMTTMNVSLPDELMTFFDERITHDGYGSTSEYVCDLTRRDRERGGGAIVTTTSVSAFAGVPGMSTYAATKAGVHWLIHNLALDLGPLGISINAVVPSGFGPTNFLLAENAPLVSDWQRRTAQSELDYARYPLVGWPRQTRLPSRRVPCQRRGQLGHWVRCRGRRWIERQDCRPARNLVDKNERTLSLVRPHTFILRRVSCRGMMTNSPEARKDRPC